MEGVKKLAGLGAGRQLPKVFTIAGDQYITTSLWRVYHGKGAPNEIQDAIWLASLCGLVDEGSLSSYVDNNLGVDCGGFVANYWGIGRPSVNSTDPPGSTGFLPRTLWGTYRNHRTSPSEIRADDAAVFFKDVKYDNPDLAASKNSDGSYNMASGSQAFHIGLVSSVSTAPGNGMLNLEIAESSGALASSRGNGVNVRSLGPVKATVANGLVYCLDGTNRVYFTGGPSKLQTYMPYQYEG
jgi:hypothetical protein